MDMLNGWTYFLASHGGSNLRDEVDEHVVYQYSEVNCLSSGSSPT
jgi:hypothetical protein